MGRWFPAFLLTWLLMIMIHHLTGLTHSVRSAICLFQNLLLPVLPLEKECFTEKKLPLCVCVCELRRLWPYCAFAQYGQSMLHSPRFAYLLYFAFCESSLDMRSLHYTHRLVFVRRGENTMAHAAQANGKLAVPSLHPSTIGDSCLFNLFTLEIIRWTEFHSLCWYESYSLIRG